MMNGTSAPTNGANDRNEVKESVESNAPPYPKIQKTHSWATKLSPEFDNAGDEAALGKMMGDDGEKLLALVDDIRQIEKLRDIELNIPQIVVIGDTSSGKSSVLQALTRLPFPVAAGLCTRFVTETTIRRCGLSERPGYKIEVKTDGVSKSQHIPFTSKAFSSDEWADVYQKLKQDIAAAFEIMSPANLLPSGSSKQVQKSFITEGSRSIPQLLRHRLEINVRKPDQAHFSIVDIPGFVNGGATTDVELSEELARQYIKNNEAIILAITPANNVLLNQKWFRLVDVGKAFDRTIGVITKCDLIENTNESKIFDLLHNHPTSEHHLKLGWFAVRNRNPEEILGEESFDQRDKREKLLFTTGKWKAALSTRNLLDPDLLGTQCLKLRLQQHLTARVKKALPGLENQIRELESKYEDDIRSMGDPRENAGDQRDYLSEVQILYEAEVERSLNGNYRSTDNKHPSRLRYHVINFTDDFAGEIRDKCIKYSWQLNDNDGDDGSGKPGILQWIDRTWRSHQGSEPRSDAPQSLKPELVKQQTESWEIHARSYIQHVEGAIKHCNDDLFEFACKDVELREKIRGKLRAEETKAFDSARAELQNLLQDRGFLNSWNPLLHTYHNHHHSPRFQRQLQLEERLKKDAKQETSNDLILQQQLASRERFDANNRVYEIHDWLYAFWEVTYPRFVDNVIIQVVERHLLGPRGPLRLFNRKWIVRLTDDELRDLAGENEESRDEREKLERRLKGLKAALEKTDNALRSKGS